MKTIVEVYASTGKLEEQMKESIMQIIGMDNSPDGARSKATIKECLSVLGELDNLLWRNKLDPAGAALMAMILDEKQFGGHLSPTPKALPCRKPGFPTR